MGDDALAAKRWTEELRDGTEVLIRPIDAGDIGMERRFIEALSPASRRFRFLESMPSPSDALLRQLTDIDQAKGAAFVAVIDDGSKEREIGVARFSATAGAADGEFAVTVGDEWRRQGLGTLLMQHLLEVARSRGIRSLHSSDANENDAMRKFAEHLHLQHQRDPDDATQVLYSIDLAPA